MQEVLRVVVVMCVDHSMNIFILWVFFYLSSSVPISRVRRTLFGLACIVEYQASLIALYWSGIFAGQEFLVHSAPFLGSGVDRKLLASADVDPGTCIYNDKLNCQPPCASYICIIVYSLSLLSQTLLGRELTSKYCKLEYRLKI